MRAPLSPADGLEREPRIGRNPDAGPCLGVRRHPRDDSAAVRHEKVYGSLPGERLIDPNPFYGRVVYTPGVVIDQPAAVTRWGLQDSLQATAQFERWLSPFTMVPHWNARGLADMGKLNESLNVSLPEEAKVASSP